MIKKEYIKKKKIFNKIVAGVMALTFSLGLAACGKEEDTSSTTGNDGSVVENSDVSDDKTDNTDNTQAESSGNSIVNIGVNDNIKSLNPLQMDYGVMDQYAVAFSYLP